MKIEIKDGTYSVDDEAMELMTATEAEFMAALSQKMKVRKERSIMKQRKKEQEAAEKRARMNALLS